MQKAGNLAPDPSMAVKRLLSCHTLARSFTSCAVQVNNGTLSCKYCVAFEGEANRGGDDAFPRSKYWDPPSTFAPYSAGRSSELSPNVQTAKDFSPILRSNLEDVTREMPSTEPSEIPMGERRRASVMWDELRHEPAELIKSRKRNEPEN
jgi:hypothetical protein